MILSTVKFGQTTPGEILQFSMIVCGGCGIPFYVPSYWYDKRANARGEFHCPNGCNRVFSGKTAEEKLKEQLEQVKAEAEKEQQKLQEFTLKVMAEKNDLQKQLKRVHKGVCPCCNRSFVNLQRHMKTKHPETLKK